MSAEYQLVLTLLSAISALSATLLVYLFNDTRKHLFNLSERLFLHITDDKKHGGK